MACDPRTRRYIARKMAEGKTKKEAVRCLCRFIAREVYRLLTGPQDPLPEPGALAGRRKSAGLTQADVAAELGVSPHKVSRLELGRAIDAQLLRAYLSLLDALEGKPTKPSH